MAKKNISIKNVKGIKGIMKDKGNGIGLKLFSVIVGIVLIMSFSLSLVSGAMIGKSVDRTMKDTLSGVASATAKAVGNSLNQYITLSETLATSNIISDPNLPLEERVDYLRPYAEDHGYFAMAIADQNKDLLSTKGIRTNASDVESIVGALDGKINITGPQVNSATQNINFFLAVPVYKDGQIINALASTMTDKQISVITEGIKFSDSGEIIVINEEGTVVASSKNPEYVTEMKNFIELSQNDKEYEGIANVSQQMITMKPGVQKEHFQGEDTYFAYAPIEGTTWSVCALAPVSEFTGIVDTSRKIMQLVVLAFLIVAVYFASRITKKITSPLETVVERMVLLSEGNLSAPVEISNEHKEMTVLTTTLKSTVEAINAYISDIKMVMAEIASGNLQVESQISYKGDFIAIQDALGQITGSLNKTMFGINEASAQVAAGAQYISAASQNLSSASEKQASHIDQLNENTNQVNQYVERNVDNIVQAANLTTEAKKYADEGSMKMEEMVLSMNSINEASKDISNIIGVIDNIAFQTNILALNAAVEAARAGAAGKGFAVVAEEVRNLASRSAEAAKESTVLLTNTIDKTQQGNDLASDTAQSFQVIVKTIDDIAKIMGGVEVDFKHQAGMIEEMAFSVDEVNAISQENSANAQQSAATSEELDAQSQSLRALVDAFRLKD